MNIKNITVTHPSLKNRDITLLLIDGKIDIPSAEFLIYESRYGGRYGGIAGKSSYKGKAFTIAELYRNLYDMDLNWRTATEFDIKKIRNAMLCWDENDNIDLDNYSYEPISNDVMNHKLNTWFKFYRYMDKLDEPNDMVLTIKKTNKYRHKGLLDHLHKRYSSEKNEKIDSWALRVKASPKQHTYHALSRKEFSILKKHLRNIDIVYQVLAIFMVETGLRITAALDAKESDFKGLLKLYANGKTLNDTVYRNYIPKGHDEYKQYELPLRTMQEVNDNYIRSEYVDRSYKYEQKMKITGKKIKENIFWITEKGKEVNKYDVWRAFSKASKIMGRTVNNITPHWLRHTFATWTIMDVANTKGIPLENTGLVPHPLLLNALQVKLGHADPLTTLRYISTALKLMGLDLNDGHIKMSLNRFKNCIKSQELVKREAKAEFGEDFDDKYFDVIRYAISREIVIDDNLIKDKKYV
ncbi:site-specific integrase [Arcobacter sp. KX21116]|uniref:tyrosine-type recombinase/integrase n=1 Tax=Arcobacter iocasae TaxID=2906515 RepID=UPI0035D4C413